MSYHYAKRTKEELEQIAQIILDRYPDRISRSVVNIEGILEDLGVTLIPRRGGLHNYALGYTPKDPRYIVVAEAAASYLPRFRPIVAEELCHIILEYDLYKEGSILPEGADGHSLSHQQHCDIEEDASYLAAAVLMPKTVFAEAWKEVRTRLESSATDEDKLIREVVRTVGDRFVVWELASGRRARDLGLISPLDYKRNCTDRIAF